MLENFAQCKYILTFVKQKQIKMSTTTLPIITDVTGFVQQSGLTTIHFQCKMFDGRGILARTFQINNYELHWYYNGLGWHKRYFPFTEFWQNSSEGDKLAFLFILITDEKSVVSMSAKGKVRSESVLIKEISRRIDVYNTAA